MGGGNILAILLILLCMSSFSFAHTDPKQKVWSDRYEVHSCRSDLNQVGTIQLGHTVTSDSCWKLSITLNLATISFAPATDGTSNAPISGRYDQDDPMPQGDNLSSYNKWGASLIEANGQPSVLGKDYSNGFQFYLYSTGNTYFGAEGDHKKDSALIFKYGSEGTDDTSFVQVLSRTQMGMAEANAVKDANGNISKILTLSVEYHAAADGKRAYFTVSDLSYAGMAFESSLDEYYLNEDASLKLSTLNYAVTLLEDSKMNVVEFTQTSGEEILVPEPASATLGFAAFALLCARRRREK